MSRVVVTGGAGFLGSHVCDRLLAEGYDVVCVDNFITGKQANVAHLLEDVRFTVMEHDVSTPLEVAGPVEAVLHLASPASPVDYAKYPIQTLKVGALGTHVTLGLAKAKDARYLLASSSEVYGDPAVNPQPEDYWGHVNPVGPRGVYDEAKRYAEAMTMAYHQEHGMRTHIARIFNTYGPRQRLDDGRAVPTFIAQALRGDPLTVYGEGTQTRSFCYVSDMVEGLYRLLEAAVYEPINLGNPEERAILELAKTIRKLAGSDSEIVFEPLPRDDPKVRRPDIHRATELLGWTPWVGLEAGLRQTIDHFRGILHG